MGFVDAAPLRTLLKSSFVGSIRRLGSCWPFHDLGALWAVAIELFDAVLLARLDELLGAGFGFVRCAEAFPVEGLAGLLGPTDVVVIHGRLLHALLSVS